MARLGATYLREGEAVQSVTGIGQNPEQERKTRMLKYTVAMTVRVICLVLGMFLQGWLMWLCFAAAIFLPYVAVILANDVRLESENKAAPVTATKLTIPASAFTIVDDAQQPTQQSPHQSGSQSGSND